MSLESNLRSLATRIATEVKAIRTLMNGNAADNSALTTTAKGNLVQAINEVRALAISAAGGGASINDTSVSNASAWSSQKITDMLNALRDQLYGPEVNAALDTFREIGDAIGQNGSAIAGMNAAIANRVRFDEAQSLTAAQKAQARTNIGAASSDDVGDTTYNFVALFEQGLA